MITCFGCRDLRAREIAVDLYGTKGVIWLCLAQNTEQHVGENTPYTFKLPQPVNSAILCWTGDADE